jgi:hypothetical protein
MYAEEEHEAQPRPRVVALLPNTNEGRRDEEENWAGRGWDLDQAERVGGWWDSDACTTGRGGGLDPACPLAGEDVGSHLAERVRRLLSEKGLYEGKEEAQGVMTIGQYAAAFPWLRASEQCALAPPSALLSPVHANAFAFLRSLGSLLFRFSFFLLTHVRAMDRTRGAR